MELSKYIDHTLLKADATVDQIKTLCEEAAEYNFMSVCINPVHIPLAKELLADSDVKVCTVIGFPLGANATAVKAFEAKTAVEDGADEVDMVINIGAAKAGDWETVEKDVRAVVEAVPEEVVVKVIIETSLLNDEEKTLASQAAQRGGHGGSEKRTEQRHTQDVHGAGHDGRQFRREFQRRGHAVQAAGAGTADPYKGKVVPGGAS